LLLPLAAPAEAQSVAELQRQIDELRAEVKALREAQGAPAVAPPEEPAASTIAQAPTGAPSVTASPPLDVAVAPAGTPAPTQLASADSAPTTATPSAQEDKPWYERLTLRGYAQMRYNAFLGGDGTAADGLSRLRSVHDSSINDDGGFLLRRVRLVVEGDVTDNISVYLQHDFGTAVNNQSSTERRENFGQLRDAYVDVYPLADRGFRLRFGQSKVPYGWENLQSSSNRLTLDRSDAINSGVPGERDLGIIAYYTPSHVQEIWDRLDEGGQKLFGNYGAFGLGVFNGQGTNRTERNGSLMTVAMATWPLELDGLGPLFRGQVLELGGSALLNNYRPELRSGGVSDTDFADERIGIHGILYPQPFGIQAEWNWGRGPQYDTSLQSIQEKNLNGGYVQVMYDLGETSIGKLIPYGRWQRFRGGWKGSVNAPRLETDEFEIGVEWQVMEALELTLAYANMKRREADERRLDRAEGDLLRTQLQWSY